MDVPFCGTNWRLIMDSLNHFTGMTLGAAILALSAGEVFKLSPWYTAVIFIGLMCLFTPIVGLLLNIKHGRR